LAKRILLRAILKNFRGKKSILLLLLLSLTNEWQLLVGLRHEMLLENGAAGVFSLFEETGVTDVVVFNATPQK